MTVCLVTHRWDLPRETPPDGGSDGVSLEASLRQISLCLLFDIYSAALR